MVEVVLFLWEMDLQDGPKETRRKQMRLKQIENRARNLERKKKCFRKTADQGLKWEMASFVAKSMLATCMENPIHFN